MSQPPPSKPYAHDVTILFGNPPREKTFTWVGSEARCRRKAIYKTLFQRVTAVRPLSRDEYIRGHGDPKLRESLRER